jgi:hypothetical protein
MSTVSIKPRTEILTQGNLKMIEFKVMAFSNIPQEIGLKATL